MKPADQLPRRFKLTSRYEHKRSEGMTHRRNKGSQLQETAMKAKRSKKQAKVVAPKVKVKVDYGRRVRNIYHYPLQEMLAVEVTPGGGPKPRVLPKVDWTPHSWKIGVPQERKP